MGNEKAPTSERSGALLCGAASDLLDADAHGGESSNLPASGHLAASDDREDENDDEGDGDGRASIAGGAASTTSGVLLGGGLEDLGEISHVVEVNVDGAPISHVGGRNYDVIRSNSELLQPNRRVRHVNLEPIARERGARVSGEEPVRKSRTESAEKQSLELDLHVGVVFSTDDSSAGTRGRIDVGVTGALLADVDLCLTFFCEEVALRDLVPDLDREVGVRSGGEGDSDGLKRVPVDLDGTAGDVIHLGEAGEVGVVEVEVMARELGKLKAVSAVSNQPVLVAGFNESAGRGLTFAGVAFFDLAISTAAVPSVGVAIVALLVHIDRTVAARVVSAAGGVKGAGSGAAQRAAVESLGLTGLSTKVVGVALLAHVEDAISAGVRDTLGGIELAAGGGAGEKATGESERLAGGTIQVRAVAVLAAVDAAVIASEGHALGGDELTRGGAGQGTGVKTQVSTGLTV